MRHKKLKMKANENAQTIKLKKLATNIFSNFPVLKSVIQIIRRFSKNTAHSDFNIFNISQDIYETVKGRT